MDRYEQLHRMLEQLVDEDPSDREELEREIDEYIEDNWI
jgi:HPt (histidine-containing phosphotransfer) domain-containing protein|tara:strand:- start:7708 stop:7824 length:117 start_codon:yes stop_codon:yes gene_type:complete